MLPTYSLPNMIEVNKLEADDIIQLQFTPRGPVEFPKIIEIHPENRTAILNDGHDDIRIDRLDLWAHLWLAPIFDQLLIRIGFVAADYEMAYGNTAKIWIKNERNVTWMLEHQEENHTWTLTRECANVGPELTPITYDDNIVFIHQIQHCLRHPEIMKEKNF